MGFVPPDLLLRGAGLKWLVITGWYRSIICIKSQTAFGGFNCLADWPRGTMDWPLAAFLFVPSWVAHNAEIFGVLKDKGVLCWNQGRVWPFWVVVFLSAWQWLGISAQTGLLPIKNVLNKTLKHFNKQIVNKLWRQNIFVSNCIEITTTTRDD